MKEIAAVREWALEDGQLPTVDLEYDEDISFDGAVLKAERAKELKKAMVAGIEIGFGRYIAELSTVAAVEHGGIAKFGKAIGMNYATVKKHRSRYLGAGQKRKYLRKRDTVTLFSENGGEWGESDTIVDEIVLKGEDAQTWRKLKPRLQQLQFENRKLKRAIHNGVCPHCSGRLDK